MMTEGKVILALEASQRTAGVALRDRAGVIHARELDAAEPLDAALMPSVDALFRSCELVPRDLDMVGVSVGPGGFSGLRVSIATARMFALARGVRCVAVPGAQVAAACYRGAGPIAVSLAAKGDSAWITYLKRMERAPNSDPADDFTDWKISGNPGVRHCEKITWREIEALISDRHLPNAMRARCVDLNVPIIEPQFDPKACLHLTVHKAQAGEFTDPLSLVPTYPRPPQAVSLWRTRHDMTTR